MAALVYNREFHVYSQVHWPGYATLGFEPPTVLVYLCLAHSFWAYSRGLKLAFGNGCEPRWLIQGGR